LVESITDRLFGKELVWQKTLRYRKAVPA
jgi:hypothetical protein